MNKNLLLQTILPKNVQMTPDGFSADILTVEQFSDCYEPFFDSILQISKADISDISGYGELDENGKTPFSSCESYLVGTFAEANDGYWYHWKEMFDTGVLNKTFFEKYFCEMLQYIPYCENQRYLCNNNTFFANLVTDGTALVGFPDWSRACICDWLLDIVILDLNKPYLLIPEHFNEYIKKKGIEILNFKERFLCMAYYKGLDTLRWHASIDDRESVESIMRSVEALGERFHKMGY